MSADDSAAIGRESGTVPRGPGGLVVKRVY